MQPIFKDPKIGRLVWRYGFCITFSMKMLYEQLYAESDTAAKESRNRYNAYAENFNNSTANIPSITLFVRMAGKLKRHRTRFYCDLFRTAVLVWPASFGKTVVALDEESVVDHVYASQLTSQIKQHFPDRKLEVAF